jgi:hypothetical protein
MARIQQKAEFSLASTPDVVGEGMEAKAKAPWLEISQRSTCKA